MKKSLIILAIAACILAFSSCASNANEPFSAEENAIRDGRDGAYSVVMAADNSARTKECLDVSYAMLKEVEIGGEKARLTVDYVEHKEDADIQGEWFSNEKEEDEELAFEGSWPLICLDPHNNYRIADLTELKKLCEERKEAGGLIISIYSLAGEVCIIAETMLP